MSQLRPDHAAGQAHRGDRTDDEEYPFVGTGDLVGGEVRAKVSFRLAESAGARIIKEILDRSDGSRPPETVHGPDILGVEIL